MFELRSVRDVTSALRSPSKWRDLVDVVTRAGELAVREFQDQLFTALTSDAAHATISFPDTITTPLAGALFAVWLGMAPETVHDDVGGSVSHVVSGVGHRHDQAWHTDSTPWLLPNRYTLLGNLSSRDVDMKPTGVLPLRYLHDVLVSDQQALSALRGEVLPWRNNFPDLPQLWGAILDPAVPRWVLPAVDPLRDRMSPALARGVRHIEEALASDQLEWYGPVAADGRLVMFDNHRVLHRGPLLEHSYGRELLRIKIGGRAVA
ncbi:hypothetical protein [Amycolatopsis sp. lyj-109]|uniref:hypothetical protein n=1 Tax=Amycolatopsis sp. lyj-109 TaxID=2789287 RepID=UPI00397E034A